MSTIVALSGGLASAFCANWAFQNYKKDEIILYFNDVKWEHPDLYRFLKDLEKYFNHKIIYDSDGRTPEELFYDHHALANNRMPFCSKELKAKRLQNFYKDGDTIIFGIGIEEEHRVRRIIEVYEYIAYQTKKYPILRFPLIENLIFKNEINKFIKKIGIEIPLLYKLGFIHNNCSGGCVRAGKGQWRKLLRQLPEVYAERERVEEEFRNFFNKDVSFMKDMSLKEFRIKIGKQQYFSFEDSESKDEYECLGICDGLN